MDVNNPTVSFVKRRRAIAGTMNKFKIPTITSGTAVPSANVATPQPVLRTNEEEECTCCATNLYLDDSPSMHHNTEGVIFSVNYSNIACNFFSREVIFTRCAHS